jgi:hypothetical protein
MPRRNDISKILMTAIGMAVAMQSISWGQQASDDSQFPPMPALKCRTVQLQSQDGAPVGLTPVYLQVIQVKWAKRNSTAATITFKVVRRLKTDGEGKVQLPELKPDTYYLALPEARKFTSGAFAIPEDSKPGNCMQPFILKDRGNMVHIEPAAPEKATDKK